MTLDGWFDATWSVYTGCNPLGSGCDFCFAQRQAGSHFHFRDPRLYGGTTKFEVGRPVWNGNLRALAPDDPEWRFPQNWSGAQKPLLGPGMPSLILGTNMGELFFQPRPVIDRVVGRLALSDHIGLLATRLPAVMSRYFSAPESALLLPRRQEHLWLGFSAEDQGCFDKRWVQFKPLADAGWQTFVSISPMRGPVTLPPDFLEYGPRTWVIVSGDQDICAPRMDIAWARPIRDLCRAASIPFFMFRANTGEEIPDDLRIRQFPRRRMGK